MTAYPEFYTSIPKCWDYLHTILTDAVHNRHSAYRTMNIAYGVGAVPYCRAVVLRSCHDTLDYMSFHTDYRTPKVQHLQKNPNIAMHFYNPLDKIQIAMQGMARTHYQNDISQQAWHKTQFLSRQGYLQTAHPSIIRDDSVVHHKDSANNLIETEHGYFNFAVVQITIHQIDFLYLHGNGNKRIIFDKNSDGIFTGQWYNP